MNLARKATEQYIPRHRRVTDKQVSYRYIAMRLEEELENLERVTDETVWEFEELGELRRNMSSHRANKVRDRIVEDVRKILTPVVRYLKRSGL